MKLLGDKNMNDDNMLELVHPPYVSYLEAVKKNKLVDLTILNSLCSDNFVYNFVKTPYFIGNVRKRVFIHSLRKHSLRTLLNFLKVNIALKLWPVVVV